MKQLLALIVLMLIGALGLSFASLNDAPVPLDYYYGRTELPLVLVVVGALALGALLGALAALGVALGAVRESQRLRRRIAVSEREIRNLREIPIKDRD